MSFLIVVGVFALIMAIGFLICILIHVYVTFVVELVHSRILSGSSLSVSCKSPPCWSPNPHSSLPMSCKSPKLHTLEELGFPQASAGSPNQALGEMLGNERYNVFPEVGESSYRKKIEEKRVGKRWECDTCGVGIIWECMPIIFRELGIV